MYLLICARQINAKLLVCACKTTCSILYRYLRALCYTRAKLKKYHLTRERGLYSSRNRVPHKKSTIPIPSNVMFATENLDPNTTVLLQYTGSIWKHSFYNTVLQLFDTVKCRKKPVYDPICCYRIFHTSCLINCLIYVIAFNDKKSDLFYQAT